MFEGSRDQSKHDVRISKRFQFFCEIHGSTTTADNAEKWKASVTNIHMQ